MGTSGGYGGSGGAWSGAGQDANDFIADPNEETAQELIAQALEALEAETADAAEAEADGEGENAPQFVAGHAALPGVRVRSRGGGQAGGGGGPAQSGGAHRGGGGGGRSGSARAGGRAIAAGFALARGDDTTLRTLGLSLAELEGLDPRQQINRILNATVPATGEPLEAEARTAAKAALIVLLVQGEESPEAVLQAFLTAYVFEAIVTEFGSKLRASDNARAREELLRSVTRAHVSKVNFSDDAVSPEEFKRAIETITGKVREVFVE